MKIRSCLAFVLTVSLVLAAPSAEAASKSQTIQVACSIAPHLQLSKSRGPESNMKNNYSASETYERRASGYTKVLTMTAL